MGRHRAGGWFRWMARIQMARIQHEQAEARVEAAEAMTEAREALRDAARQVRQSNDVISRVANYVERRE